MKNFYEYFHMTEVSFQGRFSTYFGEKSIFDEHTIIVFDSETTGLDPRVPHVQILSLSAASFDVEQEKMIDIFNQFASLNKEAADRMELDKIHRADYTTINYKYIDDFLAKSKWHDHPKSGTEIEVVANFVDFCKQFKNVLLCGYNVGFDMRMINACLKKHGHPPMSYPVMDVMRLVNIFLDPALDALASQGIAVAHDMISAVMNSANKKSYTLQNVAKILNVLKADGHVSLADIEMTGKVLTQSVKFVKDHSSQLGDNYINFEKKSRKAYKDKLKYFHSMRNNFHDTYKTKQKFIEKVQQDVHNGTLAFIKHLEAKADKERAGNKKYSILRDLQLKVNAVKNLLNNYSGDPKEIISFIYNS